ncbi:MAG: NADP-dependent methylenetetrahydromethanopterin/methylenetetrahydrofolate dehydrogenase [Gemmatimonadota bacterium]
MKKLLLQLDSDRHPSAFDSIVAFDGGADEVLAYGGVDSGDVRGLVHGAIFTRGPKELRNTAIFIGGADLEAGETLLEKAREAFFGPFRVAILLDSNGSNTTAVAAVVKLERAAGGVEGKRVLLLGGTGPVGKRAAALFATAGAEVAITSRSTATAERARRVVSGRFGVEVTPRAVDYPLESAEDLEGADIVLSCGPPGVVLLKRSAWASEGPSVLGDLNAVPPLGIEGVEATDDGASRDGATTFGAFGVGGFKLKLHKACIARLFERNDLVLDAETIFELARSL